MRHLTRVNVGRRRIAIVTGVPLRTLQLVRCGKKRSIDRATEAKILALNSTHASAHRKACRLKRATATLCRITGFNL